VFFIQAVRGLPRLRAPGIVPGIISLHITRAQRKKIFPFGGVLFQFFFDCQSSKPGVIERKPLLQPVKFLRTLLPAM